jgi:AcrR family transcriptional regulator
MVFPDAAYGNLNLMAVEGTRGVGRPRSEKARQAVLAATLELAAEQGHEGLTMEAIAKRATVSKDTLYRWWRSKTEVVLEALVEYGEQAIPERDTGSLKNDLQAFMRATAAALDPPTRQLLRTLAAGAATDPTFGDTVRKRFLDRRRAALASVLNNATRRGELTADHTETILDLVFGSLWYHLIFGVGPLDRAWADAITDTIASAATQQ